MSGTFSITATAAAMLILDNVVPGDIVMMIEADVILRGQNTADQQMVPVMARPPDTTSDITLAEWLALVKGRGKGLKLDFKSIEAVEISLQTLNEIKEEVKTFILLGLQMQDYNSLCLVVAISDTLVYRQTNTV